MHILLFSLRISSFQPFTKKPTNTYIQISACSLQLKQPGESFFSEKRLAGIKKDHKAYVTAENDTPRIRLRERANCTSRARLTRQHRAHTHTRLANCFSDVMRVLRSCARVKMEQETEWERDFLRMFPLRSLSRDLLIVLLVRKAETSVLLQPASERARKRALSFQKSSDVHPIAQRDCKLGFSSMMALPICSRGYGLCICIYILSSSPWTRRSR